MALVKEVDDNILKILTRLGYKEDSIESWPVDFYHFDQALVSIYELFLREKRMGREVIVNITSGTKPVSIAATLAAALAKCGVVYFSAEKYIRKGHEIFSEGVVLEPIVIAPLFELAEVMLPKSEEKIRIILRLLKGEARNVTAIISEEKKPEKKEIAKYTYYVNDLSRERIVNLDKKGISLTELGRLVGMLLEKSIKVEEKGFKPK